LRRRPVWAAAGVGLLVVAAFLWWILADPDQGATAEMPTAIVTRGELLVSVTESGDVEAERKKIIRNELRWPVIIKHVVPDGTRVEQGRTIIEFECKELTDEIERQELAVTVARHKCAQAASDFELKKKEMANRVRKAVQAVEDAKQDLVRYVNGEWPNKKRDAERAIGAAEEKWRLADDKLEFKKAINADPSFRSPYSENEIRAETLQVKNLKLEWEKAISEQKMLIEYDHPRQMRKLENAVTDAELELERARLEEKKQMEMAKDNALSEKSMLDMKEAVLKKLKEDYRKLVVKAEKTGLVVYDVGGNRWWRPNVTVAVGEKINQRQQLMIIPDMTTLQIKTKVYESVINQISPGLKALVRFDSMPNRPVSGTVGKVAPLPSDKNRWLNPNVKFFEVVVEFDEPVPQLKPNMTAQVDIIMARLDDVLQVPIAAVFTEQEQTFCWRVSDDRPERVAVEVGRSNDMRVEIKRGLKEGDEILLCPPTDYPATGKLQKLPAGDKLAAPTTTGAPVTRPTTQPATAPATTNPATTGSADPRSTGQRRPRAAGRRPGRRPR